MPAILPFAWRHFCTDAQDITINLSPTLGGLIEVPRLFRLQGAHIKDLQFINSLGWQGAFLCQHNAITLPTQGIIQATGIGWIYIPSPGASGSDQFSYTLTYLGQHSLHAKVNINFV